tara:strand:- start:172 stop:366 length:195 start_codon:yes stop_codon:yes gene_type:complete
MNEGVAYLIFFIFAAGFITGFAFLIKHLYDETNKPKQSKSGFVNRVKKPRQSKSGFINRINRFI